MTAYYQSHNLAYTHTSEDKKVKFWIPQQTGLNGKITLKIQTTSEIEERRSEYSDLMFLYGDEIKGENFIKIINPFDGIIEPVANINQDGIIINGPIDLESHYNDGLKTFFYNYNNKTVCYIIHKSENYNSNIKLHVEIIDNEDNFGVIDVIGNPDVTPSNSRQNESNDIISSEPHYRDDLIYYEFRNVVNDQVPIYVNYSFFPHVIKVPPITNNDKDTIEIWELSTWLNKGSFHPEWSKSDYLIYDNAQVHAGPPNMELIVPRNYLVDIENPLNIPGGFHQWRFLYPIRVPSNIEEVKDLKLYIDIDTDTDYQKILIELLPPAYRTVSENGKIINKPVFISNWTQHYSELDINTQDKVYCSNDIFWMNKYTNDNKTPTMYSSRRGKFISAQTPSDLEYYCTGLYDTNIYRQWYATRIKLEYLRKPWANPKPCYIENKGKSNGKYRGFFEIHGSGLESYDQFISTGDIDFEIYDHNRIRLNKFSDREWLEYARYGLGARNLEGYNYSLSEYIQQLPNTQRYIFSQDKGKYVLTSNNYTKYPYGGGIWWLSIKVVDYMGVNNQVWPYQIDNHLKFINKQPIPETFPNPILNEWRLIIGTTIDDSNQSSVSYNSISGNAFDINFNSENDIQGVILGNFDNNNDAHFTFIIESMNEIITEDEDHSFLNNVDENARSFKIYTNRSDFRDQDILFPTEEIELVKNGKSQYSKLIFNKNSAGCRMHYKLVEWYERGWRIGACCAVVVSYNDRHYIIIKRSIGADNSCGGGETYNGCVGTYIINHNKHPYFMFLTDDMETFSHKPTSGYIRFVEDSVVSDYLISQIQDDKYIKYKGDIEHIKNDIKIILFQSVL